MAVCAASILAIACATAGSTKNDRGLTPPRLVVPGPLERMQFTGAHSGTTLYADIDVVVDSTGAPVMSTFRVTGSAADGNHDALYHYIEASRFKPAVRDGQAVTATYHNSMKFNLQR
jgi:hypothetical protein